MNVNTCLALARKSIHNHLEGLPLPEIEDTRLTENLAACGASFVTLTISGHLRGCIGSLEAYQSGWRMCANMPLRLLLRTIDFLV